MDIDIFNDVFKYGSLDWPIFYAAAKSFIHGLSPYDIQVTEWGMVFEPPWTYLLLSPFTLFSYSISRYLVFFVGLTMFFISAVKMKANRWQLVMFMLSHPVLGGLNEGNIDWLVTAGLWMPPQLGLFFVLMKPQIGLGVATFWAYMAWRKGGWMEVWNVFGPVTIAYLASFQVYGFWVVNMLTMPRNPVSVSIFPIGIIVGVFLILTAMKRNEQNLAAIGSPFLAPYLTIYNLSGAMLSMFDRPRLFVITWVLLWIPTIIRTLT